MAGSRKLGRASDHRMAMTLAVAGLNAEKPVVIHGVECVAKSYPDFFKDIEMLRDE